MITKKYTNRFVILVTVLMVTLFSSCDLENDYYTKQGSLDFNTTNDPRPPQTDSRGNFSLFVDIYPEDIYGYNPRTDRLDHVNVRYSSFALMSSGFKNTDYVNVTLSANNIAPLNMTLYPNAGVAGTNNYYLQEFMQDFMNRLVRNGYGPTRLYIEGTVYDRWNSSVGNLSFDIEMINDLDLYLY